MSVKTYDPKQVLVSLTYNKGKSSANVMGFADGTGIKVMRTADAYSKSVGMDGDTSRVKNPDISGEITLTLAQTSPSNDILSAIANSTSDGDIATIAVKDTYGTSHYVSAYVWVKKQAEAEFSKSLTNREWVLECADLAMTTGGTTIDSASTSLG